MASRSLTKTRAVPGVAVDTVLVDDRRVDRCALDDRALRGQVASRKGDRARQPPGGRAARVHDDVIGVDAIGV